MLACLCFFPSCCVSVAAAALAGVFQLPNVAVAVLGALMTPQLRLSTMDGEMEHPLLITVERQLADLQGGGLGERVCALSACL